MNILIFSWRGPKNPNTGGAEAASHEHAKAWVKSGHSVTLFTSLFKGGLGRENMDGVNIVRRGNEVFGVHIRAFFWYFFGKHPKFDLVIDEIHGIPFFTPLYVRGKKLCFIHEVAKEVWKLNPWSFPFNLIPYLFGTIFEPFVFRLVYKDQKFMTVSDSTKDDLVNWGILPKNIKVIRNGVTVYLPKPFPKKEKLKTVMFLGALTKDKGIEDAIRAFELIGKSDPNWQFWIVGKGEENYVKKLKTMILSLNLKDKVKFWGYVSEKKKFELLARAHILVNPSVREGWGLVVVEANKVGTPVVVYKSPGLVDSTKNGQSGIILDENSPHAMAKSIIKLINNKVLYRKLSVGAKKWSDLFNWSKSGKESMNLLNSILKEK